MTTVRFCLFFLRGLRTIFTLILLLSCCRTTIEIWKLAYALYLLVHSNTHACSLDVWPTLLIYVQYCILLLSCQRLVPAMPLALVVEVWFFRVRCCCWLSFGNFIVFRLFPTPHSHRHRRRRRDYFYLCVSFVCGQIVNLKLGFLWNFHLHTFIFVFLILFFIHSLPSHENTAIKAAKRHICPRVRAQNRANPPRKFASIVDGYKVLAHTHWNTINLYACLPRGFILCLSGWQPAALRAFIFMADDCRSICQFEME